MGVYAHEAKRWKGWRVARHVDGDLRQKYFAHEERDAADRLDAQWKREQDRAQQSFRPNSFRARWRRDESGKQVHRRGRKNG